MYFVYIIESVITGQYYYGHSDHIERRLNEHNSGKSRYTKGKGPWRLLISVSFETRSEARRTEKKLKNMKSRKRVMEWIRKQRVVGTEK